MYYDLFGYLEKKLLLDVNNPSHMWALQFVYLPRINKALQMFKDGWNVHLVSTEHKLQLCILEMDKDIYQDVTDVSFDLAVRQITVDDSEVVLNQNCLHCITIVSKIWLYSLFRKCFELYDFSS